jgi:hypothetical protein
MDRLALPLADHRQVDGSVLSLRVVRIVENTVARTRRSNDSPAKSVALLKFDHDVGNRYGAAAAQADPSDTLVIAEHIGGNRALVVDLAEDEMDFAEAASAAAAAIPILVSRPYDGAKHSLSLAHPDADIVR